MSLIEDFGADQEHWQRSRGIEHAGSSAAALWGVEFGVALLTRLRMHCRSVDAWTEVPADILRRQRSFFSSSQCATWRRHLYSMAMRFKSVYAICGERDAEVLEEQEAPRQARFDSPQGDDRCGYVSC